MPAHPNEIQSNPIHTQARANPDKYPFGYKYMAQPWVLSLFFDCNRSGLTGWPQLPGDVLTRDYDVLHCPNASMLELVKGAIQRGDM